MLLFLYCYLLLENKQEADVVVNFNVSQFSDFRIQKYQFNLVMYLFRIIGNGKCVFCVILCLYNATRQGYFNLIIDLNRSRLVSYHLALVRNNIHLFIANDTFQLGQGEYNLFKKVCNSHYIITSMKCLQL